MKLFKFRCTSLHHHKLLFLVYMPSTLSHLTTLLVWPEVHLLVVYGAIDRSRILVHRICPSAWDLGLEQSGTLSARLRVYLQNSTVECALS